MHIAQPLYIKNKGTLDSTGLEFLALSRLSRFFMYRYYIFSNMIVYRKIDWMDQSFRNSHFRVIYRQLYRNLSDVSN